MQQPQSAPSDAATSPIGRVSVTKKLEAGRPGTQRYLRQFGNALVCVRYRRDPDSGKRYTTVEIVVDERSAPMPYPVRDMEPEEIVAVAIRYDETELRSQAKRNGARWDVSRKAWLMPYQTALELGLHGRVKRIRSENQNG